MEDIKINATHSDNPTYANYDDFSQLPPHVLREIRHLFEIYKDLEKAKLPLVEDFQGSIDAHQADREPVTVYQRLRACLIKGEFPAI